jgi:hypothetical protein
VNPSTDHRPTDPTVTKENRTVTSLRRFFHRRSPHKKSQTVSGQNPIPARLELRAHRRVQVKDAAGATQRFHSWVNERVAPARTLRWTGLCVSLFAALSLIGVPSAQAASPWWHLTSGSRPANLQPGTEEAQIVLTVANLGDASVDTQVEPLTIHDTLPAGLRPLSITAVSGDGEQDAGSRGAVTCFKPALTCTFSGSRTNSFNEVVPKSLPPFDQIEVLITVAVEESASPGEVNRATVSGGAAAPASIERPLAIGPQAAPFGLEDFQLAFEEEGGAPATQAGSHPFQQTITLALNRLPGHRSIALPKDVAVKLPRGLIGNPSPFPRCTLAQFLTFHPEGNESVDSCPSQTAVGVTMITIDEPIHFPNATFTLPLFNLEPSFGEPAAFGFFVSGGQVPVLIETALRSGSGEGALPGAGEPDYGITASTTNISQTAAFFSSQITLWGTPGDPRHDNARGWACLTEAREIEHLPCQPLEQEKPPALLTLPTSCTGPLLTSALADSWPEPGLLPFPSDPTQALDGCNRVPFAPTVHSEPTSDAATSPTGLNFDLDFSDEGLTNSEGLAESEVKRAVVTLPEGFTTNPSVAEGLHACTLAQYQSENVDSTPGSGCPEDSKIGDIEIESPLVAPVVRGSLFVARQRENPYGNLLTIYLVAKNPELGVLIRQALKVTSDPVTGRLTTEVDNVPQLPFSHFELSFRQGQRSPLITPPACGEYTVTALLYPYSEPSSPVERTSSFKITQGPEGQGCPSGGVPPFHPGLEAGTLNNSAGTYSPFVTHITRKDSEQEITRFSIKLPTGLIAKLKGVSECSDVQIAAAKAREHEFGASEEEAHPSCPASSEVGHTTVGTGVGNVLAYAGGKLYLAGPYHGSPISLVSINDAKVGPFDLGTVVVRFALDVNHETAEVSVDGANSDPIPHIVDGIPIHLRDIRAYVDRPGFTLNPTSCAKKSTAATILGSGLNFASSSDDVPVTVSSPFQAADCASLGFAPKLALNLVGKKTHRGALPAFKAVLTYPKYGAYANVAKAQVTLPGSEFLEQGHLKNVCTRKVFETGTNPGENCPANSIYGKARATTPLLEAPLEGPVYLRTGYGTRLPELAAALNGPQISITLAGTIDSVHEKGTEGSRIRNTFALVPDAPVEKFTLELKGGKKGLLVNSTDVCKGTHKALAAFTGQNGKLDEYEPALTAQCGKGKKKSGKKKSAGKGKGGK